MANIRPLMWPDKSQRCPGGPFCRGSQRPLKLTFHLESFTSLDTDEQEALAALREIAHLPSFEALETGPGEFPQIHIGEVAVDGKFPIRIEYPDGRLFVSGFEDQGPREGQPVRDVAAVRAHIALRGDVLVTGSTWILDRYDQHPMKRANPLLPSEAARIAGLLLRSRNDYRVNRYFSCDGGYDFYVARFLLDAFWKHSYACVEAQGVNEDALGLSGAALHRMRRALEARDRIAFAYYGNYPGATGDIEYHFDYLMLLLGGALDAQAELASLVYRVFTEDRQRFGRSFRNKGFIDAVLLANANELVEVIKTNEALLKVIAELRNAIHRAMLPGVSVNDLAPEAYHFEAKGVTLDKLNKLVKSTPDRNWGVHELAGQVLVSPYQFADTMMREMFRVVNDVAKATEIERLRPAETAASELRTEMPQGFAFDPVTNRRILIFGF